ncbi:MAG: hypothetical protein WCO56_09865 [Verrucomicrobiota bacterium]
MGAPAIPVNIPVERLGSLTTRQLPDDGKPIVMEGYDYLFLSDTQEWLAECQGEKDAILEALPHAKVVMLADIQ